VQSKCTVWDLRISPSNINARNLKGKKKKVILGNTVCAAACRRLRELQNKRRAAGGAERTN